MKNTSMHHSFDVALAAEYSIEEAIIIHHFQFWITANKRMGKNLIDGRTWTYQTQKSIAAHFPYFKNRSKISRLIEGLVEKGVLIEGRFNKTKFDRTKWYAFKEETSYLSNAEYDPSLKEKEKEEEEEDGESEHTNVRKCTKERSEVRKGELGGEQPIPYSKTDTKTDGGENARARGPSPPQESFGKFVRIPKTDLDSLNSVYGGRVISDYIERINDYIASSGVKPYKDYAAAVRNWLKRDGVNPIADKNPSEVSGISNENLARKAKEMNPKAEIEAGYKYVELRSGPMNVVQVHFSDAGFRECLVNWLRKRNLNFKGL